MCRYCSSPFFNASTVVPAVLQGPSLTVTLATGTCAIVKNNTKGEDLSDLLEDSLTCVGPELSYTKVKLSVNMSSVHVSLPMLFCCVLSTDKCQAL